MSERDLEEIATLDPRLYGNWTAWLGVGRDDLMLRPDIPGAEPLDAFAARITAFWAHVESAHRGGTASR